MIQSPFVIVPPTGDVLTLAEAKYHLRVDLEDEQEDAYIGELISTAREMIELQTRRTLLPTTFRLDNVAGHWWDFRRPIEIPAPPLIEVVEVSYLDADGNRQTVASDQVKSITSGAPGIVSLVAYPAAPDGFRIDYRAGYTVLPKCAKQAARLTVGHLYRNREATTDVKLTELPMGVKHLLAPLQWGSYC